MFTFQIDATDSKARAGLIQTSRGEIQTPVFMPCGTKATVKAMSPEELKDLDIPILLGNTYHLHLRPGEELIKNQGGLHKWMNWDRPILTDSGGFQVFSLGLDNERFSKKMKAPKITSDGVEFYSHLDGSKHFLNPEIAMQIQADLGSDIMMAFDECAPGDSSKNYAKAAMKRTHDWILRCRDKYLELQKTTENLGVLFPIAQGVVYDDLRIESTKFMAELDLPGIAIGGLSVGESKEQMYHTLDIINPYLPEQKPRYLMGVGTPEDLINGVEKGIDMFDCVLPTRLARHGTVWTQHGKLNVRNQEHRHSNQSIDKDCQCYSCQNYSLSYIHHLFRENEIFGVRLMTTHNLHFLTNLIKEIRESILKGRFAEFKAKFFASYKF